MNILIFGATGFIGKELVRHLHNSGYSITVVSRNKQKARDLFPENVSVITLDLQNTEKIYNVFSVTDTIINLAGENIASKRWTSKQKEKIINSRVLIGEIITNALQNATNKPGLLIQASAIGYYGHNPEGLVDETYTQGNDFLANVTGIWENATSEINSYGTKRALIRTGLVLGKTGGVMPKLILPVKYYLGSNFDNGQNYLSWIHIKDHIRAIEFILKKQLAGIFNLTAPEPAKAKDINKLIAKKLKRPVWFNIPRFILTLIFGKMAEELLLANQQVKPSNLRNAGFQFKYDTIEKAVNELLA